MNEFQRVNEVEFVEHWKRISLSIGNFQFLKFTFDSQKPDNDLKSTPVSSTLISLEISSNLHRNHSNWLLPSTSPTLDSFGAVDKAHLLLTVSILHGEGKKSISGAKRWSFGITSRFTSMAARFCSIFARTCSIFMTILSQKWPKWRHLVDKNRKPFSTRILCSHLINYSLVFTWHGPNPTGAVCSNHARESEHRSSMTNPLQHRLVKVSH